MKDKCIIRHKQFGSKEEGADIIANITKIKYIRVLEETYEISYISFHGIDIEAIETDNVAALTDNEVFDFSDLADFRLRLVDKHGQAEIVDFEVWKAKHK